MERWKKGLVFEGSEKGWFKKGSTPDNTLPVGTEVLVDGWVKIKTAEPNKWESKARTIWEAHYGEVPESHVVFHIDSDPTNNAIDNLELISRAELAALNKKGFHTEPKEIRPTVIAQEKLNHKIRTLVKEKQSHA